MAHDGPVYRAARLVIDAGLARSDSAFTPGFPVWTSAAAEDLQHLFVDARNTGSEDFVTKLTGQLRDASRATVQLAAELLYLYLLTPDPSSMGWVAKRDLLRETLALSPEPVAVPNDLDVALKEGITRVGTAYNTYRDRQLSFLIRFLVKWKQLSAEQQKSALGDPWLFRDVVDSIPIETAYSERNALLHLAFPDTFENIVSRDQKAAILRAFVGQVPDPTDDVDRDLLGLRGQLELARGGRVNFYEGDLFEAWHGSGEFTSSESDAFDAEIDENAAQRVARTDSLLRPVLEALVEREPKHLVDVARDVADALRLDEEARHLRTPSGHTVLENRVGWARTYLVKAGLVEQPKVGLLVLTQSGAALLADHGGLIDEAYLRSHSTAFANWLTDMGGELPEDEGRAHDRVMVWMVKAGKDGRYVPSFLEHSMILIGWGEIGDVTAMSRDALSAAVASWMPTARRSQRGQVINALYRLAHAMREGDLILTPEPTSRTVLLGRVSGPYQYLSEPAVSDYRQARPVDWFARITRDELSYGARNSLGTLLALTQPSHEEELLRLATLHEFDGRPAPLAQTARSGGAEQIAERVVIPANASVPERATTGDFQTVPLRLMRLVDDLEDGRLALPDFQRTFVWAPDATRELVVSMVRSFPAGALLFLQGGSSTFKARAAEGAPELRIVPSHLILDGQQRLTSLYQALRGVGDSRFFLDIGALLTGTEVNQAVKVFPRERAAALDSREAQARTLMMPLSSVPDAGKWRDEVVDLRIDDDQSWLRDLLRQIESTFIKPLVQYLFPVTMLPETVPLEAVCTIFETLNRTGKPLTPFELVSARVFAGGHSLYEYWNEAQDQHQILADFEVEPYYLLQCIALRLGRSCKRGPVLALDADEIAREWDSAVVSMAATLTLLRDECGIVASKWLPYRPMLIPLACAWVDIAATHGPEHAAMRAKLKRWFWCSCFTQEYESSSVSLAERDAPLLRQWLSGGDVPSVVASFHWDPGSWRTVTVRQKGVYSATIALGLVNHPLDFHTGAPLTEELIAVGHIDDHHIFPRGYLLEQGQADEIDSVLNHTLIDRATNIRIGKRPPSVYLAEMRSALGVDLDRILESHSLPTGATTPMTADDYDAFLDWRVDRLAHALSSHAGSLGDGQTSADIRRSDLDRSIEVVELGLRREIAICLAGNVGSLPEHIAANTRERIVSVARKNPGRLDSHNQTLEAYLEYCDLRDLQDIITAKALWHLFEAHFGTKESLGMRFAQLSEVRNSLRHSRAVDDVTRKDGEASLLWFTQVLARRL